MIKRKKLIKKDDLEKVSGGVKQGSYSPDLLRENNSPLASEMNNIKRKPDGPDVKSV